MKIEKKQAIGSLLGQAAFILVWVFLFTLGGTWTYLRTGGFSLHLAGIPVVAGLLLAAATAGWAVVQKPDARTWFWEKRWVVLLFVVLALLRLPQWGTLLQDDGYTYYSKLSAACATFSFDPNYLFTRFRLANHPTWGLAFLAAIPEFFLPGNTNSFLIFQTGVSLAASGCVFDLIRRHNGGREGTAFLGALVFGCSPMFLGMASYPSLEVGLSSFFFCVLWAYSRRYYLLLLFSCVLTVTSKEFGIVLAFGFFVGAFIGEFRARTETGFGRRLWAVIRTPRIGLFCVTGLCMGVAILAYLLNPALSWFDLRTVLQNHNATHLGYVGWSWTYSLYKVAELVFVNFDWLLLLVAVACLVWHLVRRTGKLAPETTILMLGALVAGILYLLFSSLAVTYTLPRYSLVTELIVAFCAILLLVQTLSLPRQRIACAVLAVLLGVQGYFCIDPVMKWFYPEVSTGGIPMARASQADGRHMGDYMVYNYQYSYLRRGLREIFRQYDPSEYDLVVLDRDGWIYLTYLYWNGTDDLFEVLPSDQNIPIPEYQTDTTQGNSVDKALAQGILQSKAIILWSPTYRESTPTPEQAKAQIPSCYTNIEQHEWDGGLSGKIVYFTADLVQE